MAVPSLKVLDRDHEGSFTPAFLFADTSSGGQCCPKHKIDRSPETSCLLLLRPCSSEGTSKEFVHSSPTSVQGQGGWESKFTEEARMVSPKR